MFKRLFLLSGVIAFVLAALTMWLWYIPMQREALDVDKGSVPADTVITDTGLP